MSNGYTWHISCHLIGNVENIEEFACLRRRIFSFDWQWPMFCHKLNRSHSSHSFTVSGSQHLIMLLFGKLENLLLHCLKCTTRLTHHLIWRFVVLIPQMGTKISELEAVLNTVFRDAYLHPCVYIGIKWYKAQRRHVLASINDKLIWEQTGQTKTNMDCTGTVCPATPISHYSIYILLTCPGQPSMTDIFFDLQMPIQFRINLTWTPLFCAPFEGWDWYFSSTAIALGPSWAFSHSKGFGAELL